MPRLPLPVRTDRLVLRCFTEADRALERAIHSDRSLFAHLPIEPRSDTELDEYVKARLEHQTLDEVGATTAVVIETSNGSNYVGSIQLTPVALDPLQVEIGWLALAGQQGNGYLTEAVRKTVELVFTELDAHRVVAEIIAGNDASVRLAERLGFRQEARFVKSVKIESGWRDELVFSILKDEWHPSSDM